MITELEDNDYDFSQDIDQILDDIISENLSESDKLEFKKYLLLIVRQNAKKLSNLARTKMYSNFSLRNDNFSNTNQPNINIILLNQPNYGLQANPTIYNPSMLPNSYQPSISPTQIPFQSQFQMSPYQQQLINPNNSIQPTIPQHSKKHHHHDKSKKYHKEKKSSKTSKKHSKKDKKQNYDIQTFNYQPGNDFEGIFNFLTTKFDLNPHDKGEIEITTNSMNKNNRVEVSHPKNLINFRSSNNYKAEGSITDLWVLFDFKTMKVEISSYSIKSSRNSLGHIKNWIIEISEDGEKWDTIDSQSECKEMDSPGAVMNFKVNDRKKKKFVRFCRFHHNGSYWGYSPGMRGNGTYVEFNSFELFGRLKIPK